MALERSRSGTAIGTGTERESGLATRQGHFMLRSGRASRTAVDGAGQIGGGSGTRTRGNRHAHRAWRAHRQRDSGQHETALRHALDPLDRARDPGQARSRTSSMAAGRRSSWMRGPFLRLTTTSGGTGRIPVIHLYRSMPARNALWQVHYRDRPPSQRPEVVKRDDRSPSGEELRDRHGALNSSDTVERTNPPRPGTPFGAGGLGRPGTRCRSRSGNRPVEALDEPFLRVEEGEAHDRARVDAAVSHPDLQLAAAPLPGLPESGVGDAASQRR